MSRLRVAGGSPGSPPAARHPSRRDRAGSRPNHRRRRPAAARMRRTPRNWTGAHPGTTAPAACSRARRPDRPRRGINCLRHGRARHARAAAHRADGTTTADHPAQGDTRVVRRTAQCGNVAGIGTTPVKGGRDDARGWINAGCRQRQRSRQARRVGQAAESAP